MKRKTASLLCAAALVLPMAGCAVFGVPDYTLSVTVEAGVTGTPASGVYTYPDLEEVSYKYTAVDPRHSVEVLVDNGGELAESSVTIFHDTELVARLFDVRGSWKVTSFDADGNSTEFTVAFAGADLLGGTFSDSRGHYGAWTAVSGKLIFTYADLESFVYTGAEIPVMTGTWANGSATGSWSASRQS